MRRQARSLVALALLVGLGVGACAQENPLEKAVAPLFSDRQKVEHAAYAAWKTARDEGPRASLEKSSKLLEKVTAFAEEIPAQAAPDAFAAWWYNIAAQYWLEIAAKDQEEVFAKAIGGIKRARWDQERAMGWDAEMANQAFQDAYRLMQGFK